MTEPTGAARQFNPDQLGRLHGITQQVEKTIRAQLRTYLDALAPLFRPRRILGSHLEGSGKENVIGADQSFNELREIFFKACGRPFDLRKELPDPLESVPTQIQLHEWEYSHEIPTERGPRAVTIVAPLTWVLAYPSTHTYSMVRQIVVGKQELDAENVRSFLLRASLMSLMFLRLPELTTLFEGLRYRVETRRLPQLGDLPLVTVSAPIATHRPGDDVLLLATAFAGRSVFVEVVDPEESAQICDPLQEQILKILESANEASTTN